MGVWIQIYGFRQSDAKPGGQVEKRVLAERLAIICAACSIALLGSNHWLNQINSEQSARVASETARETLELAHKNEYAQYRTQTPLHKLSVSVQAELPYSNRSEVLSQLQRALQYQRIGNPVSQKQKDDMAKSIPKDVQVYQEIVRDGVTILEKIGTIEGHSTQLKTWDMVEKAIERYPLYDLVSNKIQEVAINNRVNQTFPIQLGEVSASKPIVGPMGRVEFSWGTNVNDLSSPNFGHLSRLDLDKSIVEVRMGPILTKRTRFKILLTAEDGTTWYAPLKYVKSESDRGVTTQIWNGDLAISNNDPFAKRSQ